MVTAKSYFSGAGGMDLGLIQAGINITHSYEIDKICCKTLKNNFSHEIHQEDITKIEKNPDIDIPKYVYARLNGAYRDKPIISNPDMDDLAPCCVAHYSKDKGTRMVQDGNKVRPYTPKEYARLQGFPDSFKFAGTGNQIYKQVGNAVAVPMARWIGQPALKYFS